MDKTKIKKVVPLVCVAVVLLIILCVAAVIGFSSKTCTVTFRQEGKPDIVCTVPRGESLKDVPEIEQIPGYTITWSVDDFSCVKKNMVVEAVKTPNQYTIFYDTGKEEAQIDITAQKVTYGTSFTLPHPTCEGYTFSRWVIAYSSTEVKDGVYDFVSDLPLRAVWIPHSFTITYETGNPNAKIGRTEQKVLYQQPCTLEKPTCIGMVFKGWQIEGTDIILSTGDPYPELGDLTLIAMWEPDPAYNYWLTKFEYGGGYQKDCTVTFRQEGQRDIVRTVTRGAQLNDVPNVTPITGYDVFWSRSDFSSITTDTVVVAMKTPCRYTVTYDKVNANAVISKESQTVFYGSSYTLEIPTCEGHTFGGWKIKGTTEIFPNTGSYNKTSDITLEAVWKRNNASSYWVTDFEFDENTETYYTVTFRQEGKDDVVRKVKQGEALTNIPTAVQDPGYVVNWSRSDFSSITSNTLVTAYKIPATYTISYNGTTLNVVYKTRYTLEEPTREGYTFGGWKIQGTTETFPTTGSYNKTSDITLEAVWNVNGASDQWLTDFEFDENAKPTHTVTFRQAGQADIEKTVGDGETLTDIPTAVQDPGYVVNWSRNDFTNITSNILVTAYKIPAKFTITFVMSNGAPQIQPMQVTYGGAYTLEEPSFEGYTFLGWKINDEDTEYFPKNGTYNETSSITLKAVWASNEYTITYDKVKETATISKTTDTVTPGNSCTLLTPTCDGYTFGGWKIDGTETVLDVKDPYTPTGSVTLVAQWQQDTGSTYWLTDFEADDALVKPQYTITYDKVYANAVLNKESQTVTFGEAYTLVTPTCEGYTFAGWKIKDSAIVLESGEAYTLNRSVTLVAQWKAATEP